MTTNPFYDQYLSTHLGIVQSKSSEQEIMAALEQLYRPHLPTDKQAAILDVGCGKGNFLKFLLREGYENFLGVDIGREQIAYCRQNVSERVEFIENLTTFLAERPANFDLIVMLDVLEHIARPQLIPLGRQIHQALRENGRLLIKTVNAANPIAAQMIFCSDLTHEVMFSEISLRQWSAVTGFQAIQFFAEERPPKGIKRAIRKAFTGLIYRLYGLLYSTDYISFTPRVLTPNLIAVARK
jgi:2-polyprenyl-3-methyl-5-hydroxy-6-metoxy-1,4-benzoquinol methylase